MSELTVDALVTIMRECAGEEEPAGAIEGDIGDVAFEILGYDSLALMEGAAAVKRTYQVTLPDDVLVRVRTLNEFVAAVNDAANADR